MIILARNKTRDPINIQNSRLYVLSSFLMVGIDLSLAKYSISIGIKKVKRNKTSCSVMSAPVNACTDVSPRMPLLVRKVEYKTRENANI
jgi:hypothetical protein